MRQTLNGLDANDTARLAIRRLLNLPYGSHDYSAQEVALLLNPNLPLHEFTRKVEYLEFTERNWIPVDFNQRNRRRDEQPVDDDNPRANADNHEPPNRTPTINPPDRFIQPDDEGEQDFMAMNSTRRNTNDDSSTTNPTLRTNPPDHFIQPDDEGEQDFMIMNPTGNSNHDPPPPIEWHGDLSEPNGSSPINRTNSREIEEEFEADLDEDYREWHFI
jgi:hypothetical protein